MLRLDIFYPDALAGLDALRTAALETAADCRAGGVDLAQLIRLQKGALIEEGQREKLVGLVGRL